MNIAFSAIILISFLVSTLTGVWILKAKQKKWLGLFVSLCINTIILSGATLLLYRIDVAKFHKQTEGLFESLGVLILVFFIPILTLINYYFLVFVSRRIRHI